MKPQLPPHTVVLVLSAPSGAGKRTLLQRLQQLDAGITTTVSATTRAPRPGEVDGEDYYFLSEAEFDLRQKNGDFLEWAVVHGRRYGTLVSELERCARSGKDAILELDVQGMRNLRALGIPATTVFLMPPSLEELERRLRGRGDGDPEDVALRLKNAEEEMAAQNEFDFVVINDDLDRAVAELREILQEARLKIAAAAQE